MTQTIEEIKKDYEAILIVHAGRIMMLEMGLDSKKKGIINLYKSKGLDISEEQFQEDLKKAFQANYDDMMEHRMPKRKPEGKMDGNPS